MAESTPEAPEAIDPAYREMMNALSQALDEMFNGPRPRDPETAFVGFFLCVFPGGEPGRFNYISNTDKLDVREMLLEIIARIDGRLAKEAGAKRAEIEF